MTKAAARLHISQPPLSRQIRDLEAELQVELFQRSGKSVRLTDAGRLFLEEARAVLVRAEEAMRAVRAVAGGQRGEIHVGYAPSLTVELLPRALRNFEATTPGVRVVLHDLSTEELLGGLQDRGLDIALMIRPGARLLGGLVFKELRRFRVMLATAPGHALTQGPKPTLRRVFAERLIAYTRSGYPEYHAWLGDLAAKCSQPLRIGEEHDSATSLIAAVEAGRGVALVPETFACFVGSRLALRPITPAPAPLIVGVCHRMGSLSDVVQSFARAASDHLDSPGKR